MIDNFIEKINEIYKLIVEPISDIYKEIAIGNYKKQMGIRSEEFFSAYYYSLVQLNREKGVVYTSYEIAEYIIKNTVYLEDIMNNPYLKIIDPACGSGNIIIPCYSYLYNMYKDNLKEINKRNKINIKEEEIGVHIVKNNLFGFDIDETALKVLKIDLYTISKFVFKNNFLKKDFLTEELLDKFDIFISNPPYVGQKSVNRAYSTLLKSIYREVYKDKGDISYCFFHKAILNLNKKGKLSFITSRYFLESPSGEILRKILKELCSINKIVDFYGIRPFKKAGIDPVIIFLNNEQNLEKEIEVIKPKVTKGKKKKEFLNTLVSGKGDGIVSFYIKKNLLNNSGWILRNSTERTIINKIENASFTTLNNICSSFQGIITGCDKAYIVDSYIAKENGLERELLKPWIKSSSIERNKVHRNDKYLIYSDKIQREEGYEASLKYISKYREKLMNRRECKNGIRKWYQLQWGRTEAIFEGTKIVLPYKSESNRFALDTGSYFSADVYALILKENVPFTYDYLLHILNSDVYEFYFKTFGKKLGENLYEYYPNNLMKLCIPTMKQGYDEENYLYRMFDFTKEEVHIIKSNYVGSHE